MRHLATMDGAEAIFLFIAELNGFKVGSETDKVNYGQSCYVNDTLHDLDLAIEEDRKELHENIWLERLYDELDHFFQLIGVLGDLKKKWVVSGKRDMEWLMSTPATDFYWSVPIELDASALTK